MCYHVHSCERSCERPFHVYIGLLLPGTTCTITSVQSITVARSIQSFYLFSYIARPSLDSRLTARLIQTQVPLVHQEEWASCGGGIQCYIGEPVSPGLHHGHQDQLNLLQHMPGCFLPPHRISRVLSPRI